MAAGGSDPTQNLCGMTCDGNTTEYCGGPNRLNTYRYNASLASASSAVPIVTGLSNIAISSNVSVTSMSLSTVASTPTSPVHVQTVGSYVYQGCWNDTQQNSNTRTLGAFAYFNTTGMTVELCATQCAGYAWMGVEYGQEWRVVLCLKCSQRSRLTGI